ncbi:vWA domain-containing protein [Corynebacterium pygosceleis]|uniref:VWA domain-containing protein n=1 Tax=Corynebacterium pygosceleis TaxID=2800406 RepID=A0A9Q4C6X7_9CORY|nr:VWA domain-containing protein [Corynebacterium pygosceleis]MCK7636791.1 VWA domain-containing protein [Corynebacterium pygosceleis]MCK7674265.1 VWA domain-containing protein [Corynebacterium pygosceleis]MCL0120437.1 VWA domain-containing protein [Corynebacterium pygosceleis]MCX7443984.1 VWA domain-containing protein [Corynebacterium pygosceleis]MCX7467544.1 VWA domain-containing protein [Corynebacterium pygosceleis]
MRAPPFVPRALRRKGAGEEGIPGRRSRSWSAQGQNVRAVAGGHGLNVVGTVLAAAERGARITDGLIDFRPEDLRGSLRRGTESNLIVFVVDASGSMAGRDRLSAVTGAVVSMLRDAYQRRDRIAVISVRGSAPEVLLPPTGSTVAAVRRLDGAVTGGRTPLGEGLMMAHELVEREHRREPGRRALLVVLSDGRATGASGTAGVRRAAAVIRDRGLAGSLVIDCERAGRIRLGLAADLAKRLEGVCVRLDEISADSVAGVIEAV